MKLKLEPPAENVDRRGAARCGWHRSLMSHRPTCACFKSVPTDNLC